MAKYNIVPALVDTKQRPVGGEIQGLEHSYMYMYKCSKILLGTFRLLPSCALFLQLQM